MDTLIEAVCIESAEALESFRETLAVGSTDVWDNPLPVSVPVADARKQLLEVQRCCTAALLKLAQLNSLHTQHSNCKRVLAALALINEAIALHTALNTLLSNDSLVLAQIQTAVNVHRQLSFLLVNNDPVVVEALWRERATTNAHAETERRTLADELALAKDRIIALLDLQIDALLAAWTDTVSDPLSLAKLHGPAPTDPLRHLFCAFPLVQVQPRLLLYARMNAKAALRLYAQKLLNRFYHIVSSSDQSSRDNQFSVGPLEAIAPESLKFAVRLGSLLDATEFLVTLHSELQEQTSEDSVPDSTASDGQELANASVSSSPPPHTQREPTIALVGLVLREKCVLVARLIRDDAEAQRRYHDPLAAATWTPKHIDALLGETALISKRLARASLELTEEHGHWRDTYDVLERAYLQTGIQTAIELDQVLVAEGTPPLSTCIDDIFFVLKAARDRLESVGARAELLDHAFRTHFLAIVQKRLARLALELRPGTGPEDRSMQAVIVLVNSLHVAARHWQALRPGAKGVEDELRVLVEDATKAVYARCLQAPLNAVSTECSAIKDALRLGIVDRLGRLLDPQALKRTCALAVGDFDQRLAAQILEQKQITPDAPLRLDTELHDLEHWLTTALSSFSDVAGSFAKTRQCLAVLLSEDRPTAQQLIDEWQHEGTCRLRAGELMLLLSRLKK